MIKDFNSIQNLVKFGYWLQDMRVLMVAVGHFLPLDLN